MENKITKKDRYNEIIAILEKMENTEELVQFVQHEVELLNRKTNSPRKKPNAEANGRLDEKILEVLGETETPMTASAILVAVGNIEGIDTLTLPRINSRLSYLGKETKQIDRSKTKKGVLFSIGTGTGFNESNG